MDPTIKYKLIIKTLLGTLIGMLISIMIFFLDGLSGEGSNDHVMYTIQFLGSGLNGAICMGSSVIYEFEDWGLRKITILHYIICMISVMTASALLHWFEPKFFLILFPIFTVAYFAIWLTEYIFWKREVRLMNRELENMRKQEQEVLHS